MGSIELAIGVSAVTVFGLGLWALARLMTKILRRSSGDTRRLPGAIHKARHKGYRVFTSEFDCVAEPHTAVHDILGPLPEDAALETKAQWREFQADLDGMKPRLRTAAARAAARIGDALPAQAGKDIVVSLLLGHSGSLRNRPILVTAVSVFAAVECLRLLGIRTEILGFTTSRWKGGLSRQRWNAKGRRPEPGRLNDLLHIVYRNAGDNGPLDMGMFRTMLRRDLLKENIDGEAVEWAAHRLRKRPERRKLLVLVSDGAPVDDSTILENGETYLPRHFESVVRRIEGEGKIEAGSVMHTNQELSTFTRARRCASVETLGEELIGLIEEMLLSEIAMVRRDEAVG